jgi:hypothetical protein
MKEQSYLNRLSIILCVQKGGTVKSQRMTLRSNPSTKIPQKTGKSEIRKNDAPTISRFLVVL